MKPCMIILAFCIAAAAGAGAPATQEAHPPIPVRFTLKEPGFVTLVIEDASGMRVRNLISETPFPAGQNVAWWDGLDDLGRDPGAASHFTYSIPGKLVGAGTYRVRGLVRLEIGLRYEMTPYNEGAPPWKTKDRASEWLANHTPPAAVLFVPDGAAPDRPGHPAPGGQIVAGSFVSEGGSGLAWLDLDGHKLNGQLWIGGVWTGATHLARDEGDKPLPGIYAYTGAAWTGDKYNGQRPELRLFSLMTGKSKAPKDQRFGTGEDQPLLVPNYALPTGLSLNEHEGITPLGGLAARNGIVVVAITPLDQLLFIDAAAHRALATTTLEKPRGLAFDKQGRLLAISGDSLVRMEMPSLPANPPTTQPIQLAAVQRLVDHGLDDPQQLALDAQGNIFCTLRGKLHQVIVLSPEGQFRRSIGTPGSPSVGPYDPRHMNNPYGLTIDSRDRLWVAEQDKTPKRVSVWSTDGKLIKAFYGPAQYGGGGELSPLDKSRFFYADEGGMEFKLDWSNRTSQPAAVYYRKDADDFGANSTVNSKAGHAPQTPLHIGDRTYLVDCFNANPTNGSSSATVWLLKEGVARRVAVIGRANDWLMFNPPAGSTPQKTPFQSRLPAGVDLKRDKILFAWSDLNDDGKMQPEEVTSSATDTIGVCFMADLSAITASGLLLKPRGFTPGGAPIYDAAKAIVAMPGAQRPTSSGGGQAILGRDDKVVLTVAPKPFAPQSIGGGVLGKATWSYPSLWPGLHASHSAPLPDRPGEMIGTTRLLGNTITPRASDAGEIFALNGNKGNVYLMTTDGLFVATLFKDCRTASWSFPEATRGMPVGEASLAEENFWPYITQINGGEIYLQAMNSALVRLDGLEQIRRLPDGEISVTPQQLAAAQDFFLETEAARQASAAASGPQPLAVQLRANPPVVDGKLEDWAGAQWATIDVRSGQVGDWGRRTIETRAAVCVAGDKLFAAFQSDDAKLLANSGDSSNTLFKTGGALDLMIGANADADPKRRSPAPGDLRLLISQVKGKTVAMRYRPVAPGSKIVPVPFSSPLRTIRFDRVNDISSEVTLASFVERDEKAKKETAGFEVSVPLSVVGLNPRPGRSICADVGVLRGNGFQTLQRVYWNNKATGITSDEPSEAELTPQLWGRWEFVEGK